MSRNFAFVKIIENRTSVTLSQNEKIKENQNLLIFLTLQVSKSQIFEYLTENHSFEHHPLPTRHFIQFDPIFHFCTP